MVTFLATTALVSEAHAALALTKNESTPDSEDPSNPTASTPPRSLSHWSFYLLLLGGLAAGSTAIAVAVMGLYALTAISTIFCVINLIGAFYLRRFVMAHTLGAILQAMTQRVKEQHTNNEELRQENKQIALNLKDMRTQKEKADNEISSLQKVQGDKSKEMRQNIKELQAVNLDEVQNAHEKTNEVVENAVQEVESYLKAEESSREAMLKACERDEEILKEMQTLFENMAGVQHQKTEQDQSITQIKAAHYDAGKVLSQLLALCRAKDRLIAKMIESEKQFTELVPTITASAEKEAQTVEKLNKVANKLGDRLTLDRQINAVLRQLMRGYSSNKLEIGGGSK